MATVSMMVILTLAGASVASAQSGPVALVKTGQLNLRSGPGPGYSVVGALQFGQEVVMIGRTTDSGWAQVTVTGGVTGWASTLYLLSGVPFSSLPVTAQAVPWAFITAGTVNLRSGPGLEFSVIKTINGGNYVNIFARSLDTTWIYVMSNGDAGWLSIGVLVSSTPFGSLPTSIVTSTPATTAPGTPTAGTPASGGTGGTGTGNGIITGTVKPLHVGDLIPRLNIYAVNVATGAWVGNQFYDSCAAGFDCVGEYPGHWTFSIGNVPPGDYAVFAYKWMIDNGFWGADTKNPKCNGSGTPEDHSFVLVHVTAGATVTGADLCDTWGPGDGVIPPEPHN